MSQLTAYSAIAAGCTLGEGPVWHEDALWWVDIEGKLLHQAVPGESSLNTHAFPDRIGFAVPAVDGTWRVGLQTGIHAYSPEKHKLSLLHAPEMDLPNNRFNDGKCDPSGRLWAGTMTTRGEKNTGTLYRIDDGRCDPMISGVTISNGLAWDSRRKRMYYIDTPTQEVAAFDYNPKTGEITNRRVAFHVSPTDGSPDGMTIDSKGNLWIALWGGYGVIQVDPEEGCIVSKVAVPAPNVTSCTFGDPHLETLYITTARAGMKKEQLADFPLAGNVFAVTPGCRGEPITCCAGQAPEFNE